jgi:glycerol-3-phosphate dehydrogenase
VLDAMGDDPVFASVPRRSPTRRLKLWGAGNGTGGRRRRSAVTAGAALDVGESHLALRYGTDAGAVLDLVRETPALGEPLTPSLPYLRAEVVFAARYEMAGTVDDVLTRRTRARLLDNAASAAAAEDVAALLASELGWDDATQAAEVAAYRAACAAERAAAGL